MGWDARELGLAAGCIGSLPPSARRTGDMMVVCAPLSTNAFTGTPLTRVLM